MKIIGITGGIGSGKTLVSKIIINLGYHVYNSDIRAKYLMNYDKSLINSIKYFFGKKSYLNNKLNKKFISSLIFSNITNFQLFSNLVYSKIERDFELFKLNYYHTQNFIFKEAAILYESSTYKKCDMILLVTCDDKTRINRIIKRNQFSYNEIFKRMNHQWSESQKINLADFIIYNNGTIQNLNNKIQEVLQYIIKIYS